MQPIHFSPQNSLDLEAQLNFLIRRELFLKYHPYRKIAIYVLGISLSVLALLFFTESNDFITLKAIVIILLSLIWSVVVLFTITIIYKWINRQSWKRKVLEYWKSDSRGYTIWFDSEKIVFESDTYKSELTWDYYKFWMENRNSLFIFPKDSLYEAIFYSITDLGEENYQTLKAIVTEKLTKLDK